jgi:hypothetical protein
MAKDKDATTTSADDGGVERVLETVLKEIGEAVAVGQDTFSSVDATSNLSDNGNVTKATGVVVAVAISDGPVADTDVHVDWSGDKIHIKNSTIAGEQDGVSYEISVLTFKAMDHDHKDGETTVKFKDKSPEVDDQGHHYLDFKSSSTATSRL